jgi:hypothetical protein
VFVALDRILVELRSSVPRPRPKCLYSGRLSTQDAELPTMVLLQLLPTMVLPQLLTLGAAGFLLRKAFKATKTWKFD